MKTLIGVAIVLSTILAFFGFVLYRAMTIGGHWRPPEIADLTTAMQNYKENQTDFPPCMLDTSPDRKHRFMAHLQKAFPNADYQPGSDEFDALNQKVQDEWKYNFAHTESVLIPLNLETLDPAEAFVFWLGGFPTPLDEATKKPIATRKLFGFHRDSDHPFKRDIPTLEDLRYRTEPLYGFDPTRLVDSDHDGWLEYSPGWSEESNPLPPFVYFDGATYVETTKHRASLGTCGYPNDSRFTALWGTAVPYLMSFVPGRPEESKWAKDTGLQIISAGRDGKYGPATPRLVVFPSLETYDAADGFQRPHPADKTERDNLTNLSNRTLGEAKQEFETVNREQR
jgi:hypothetical protein